MEELSSAPVFYELEELLSPQEQVPMPFNRNELTFGMIADINAKSLCYSLAGGAIGMKELYEKTCASEVFEMHVIRTIEQYNERILHKRYK